MDRRASSHRENDLAIWRFAHRRLESSSGSCGRRGEEEARRAATHRARWRAPSPRLRAPRRPLLPRTDRQGSVLRSRAPRGCRPSTSRAEADHLSSMSEHPACGGRASRGRCRAPRAWWPSTPRALAEHLEGGAEHLARSGRAPRCCWPSTSMLLAEHLERGGGAPRARWRSTSRTLAEHLEFGCEHPNSVGGASEFGGRAPRIRLRAPKVGRRAPKF